MLELWGMRRTPLLPSLPGSLWLGVEAPDRLLFMVQIEQNCVLMINWIVWNRTAYMYKNGHYLHFSDYCSHLCCHVYHKVSAVVRSGLLQVIGMSNLALYFAHRGRLFQFHEPCLMDVSYQLSPVNLTS